MFAIWRQLAGCDLFRWCVNCEGCTYKERWVLCTVKHKAKIICKPEFKSHNRIERSRPSLSPDKRILPSGSSFNNVTGALWPDGGNKKYHSKFYVKISEKVSYRSMNNDNFRSLNPRLKFLHPQVPQWRTYSLGIWRVKPCCTTVSTS